MTPLLMLSAVLACFTLVVLLVAHRAFYLGRACLEAEPVRVVRAVHAARTAADVLEACAGTDDALSQVLRESASNGAVTLDDVRRALDPVRDAFVRRLGAGLSALPALAAACGLVGALTGLARRYVSWGTGRDTLVALGRLLGDETLGVALGLTAGLLALTAYFALHVVRAEVVAKLDRRVALVSMALVRRSVS